jgi:hypothetical protein
MRPSYRPPATTTATSGPSPLLVVLLIAAILWAVGGRGCSVTPSVPSQPPAGPDLTKAFSTNDNRAEAKAHAHVFATICGALAEYIEYDGQRPEPLLKTGVQIDDLRLALRQTRTKGWSFLTKYPDLKEPLETFFTKELGAEGGPIDAAKRSKWVSAMRTLATSAEYAAR